jgi:hypothetical protein
MASFQIGTKLETTENFIDVTVTPDTPLAPGIHHFQVIVLDDAQNESAPATAQVIVRDTIRPTAVLEIVPTQVQPGQPFRLDGSKSSDVPPGKVLRYLWIMVD